MKGAKDLSWTLYLDAYGSFLTERQAKLFTLYYNEDCSLAEIADQLGISRQGVLDGIRRARTKLEGMEKKLGLIKSRMEEEDGV
jgi:predicted DNA-binding protein YlxM (UPF0122 family)